MKKNDKSSCGGCISFQLATNYIEMRGLNEMVGNNHTHSHTDAKGYGMNYIYIYVCGGGIEED